MLYRYFPRDFSLSRWVVNSLSDFIVLINRYNQKREGYSSIYGFKNVINGRIDYDSPIIDKLFFDFDVTNCKEITKLHKYLMEENLKHLMVFSGRGFHFYIFTKVIDLSHPKSAIKNAQLFFAEKLGLKGADEKIIGDVARISRIPNTWNIKRERYVIPIDEKFLEAGYDFINERAKHQNFNFKVYGKNLLDLNKFDYARADAGLMKVDFDAIDKKGMTTEVGKRSPSCICVLLEKKDCNWQERYLLITFLIDGLHLLPSEVISILKKHLSPEKFKHCVFEEKQVQYLFKRQDLFFSCKKAKEMGYCPFKEKICKIGLKIYS